MFIYCFAKAKEIKVKLAYMGFIGSLKIRYKLEKHFGLDNILSN